MFQGNKLTKEAVQKLREKEGKEAMLIMETGRMENDNPMADGKCWPDKDEGGTIVGWFFESNVPAAHATHYVDAPQIKGKGRLEIEYNPPGYDIVIEEVQWPCYYLAFADLG